MVEVASVVSGEIDPDTMIGLIAAKERPSAKSDATFGAAAVEVVRGGESFASDGGIKKRSGTGSDGDVRGGNVRHQVRRWIGFGRKMEECEVDCYDSGPRLQEHSVSRLMSCNPTELTLGWSLDSCCWLLRDAISSL